MDKVTHAFPDRWFALIAELNAVPHWLMCGKVPMEPWADVKRVEQHAAQQTHPRWVTVGIELAGHDTLVWGYIDVPAFQDAMKKPGPGKEVPLWIMGLET